MEFVLIIIAIMAVCIICVHKLASMLGFNVTMQSLVLCGILALLVNFSAISISSYLTKSHYMLLGSLIIAASLAATMYNRFVLQHDSCGVLTDGSSALLPDIDNEAKGSNGTYSNSEVSTTNATDDIASEDTDQNSRNIFVAKLKEKIARQRNKLKLKLVKNASTDEKSTKNEPPDEIIVIQGAAEAHPCEENLAAPENATNDNVLPELSNETNSEEAIGVESANDDAEAESTSHFQSNDAVESDSTSQAKSDNNAEIEPNEKTVSDIDDKAKADEEIKSIDEETKSITEANTTENIESSGEAESTATADETAMATIKANMEPGAEAGLDSEAEDKSYKEEQAAVEIDTGHDFESDSAAENSRIEIASNFAEDTGETKEAESTIEIYGDSYEDDTAITESEFETSEDTKAETETEVEADSSDKADSSDEVEPKEMMPTEASVETMLEDEPEEEIETKAEGTSENENEIEAEAETENKSESEIETSNDIRYNEATYKSAEAAELEIDIEEVAFMVSEMETLDDILDYAYSQRSHRHFQPAMYAYGQCLVRYPDDGYMPFVVIDMINTCKEAGEYGNAIACYQKALDLPMVQSDRAMQHDFQNSLYYITIVKQVLTSHNIASTPFSEIPAKYMTEIEDVFSSKQQQE